MFIVIIYVEGCNAVVTDYEKDRRFGRRLLFRALCESSTFNVQQRNRSVPDNVADSAFAENRSSTNNLCHFFFHTTRARMTQDDRAES